MNIDEYKKEFITNSVLKYNNKYDYSLVNYVNKLTPVKILCHKHGEFEITPKAFLLSKHGCQKCAKETIFNDIRERETIKFITSVKEKFGDKYDLSLVNYINNSTPVKIICQIHGEFLIRPSVLLTSKYGCQSCAIESNFNELREKETTKFIENSKIKYNNKYDYSLVNYINNSTRVKIICPIHGEFTQEPYVHLSSKFGCNKCSDENKIQVNKSLDYYIEKSNIIHGNKFDYSKIDINSKSLSHTKVPIVCKNGHTFYQNFHDHISGNGCPLCVKPCNDTESFIRLSNEKHDNMYDYSKTVYKKQKSKVIIICKKHGEFTQTPTNHYFLGRGCPSCKTSNGENEIKRLLKKYNIEFEQQKTFKGCKNKSILRFDFYIPEHNMCIEFDGKQHFEPIKRFGGEDTFIKTKINDNIKDEFCLFEGIRLIRIKYTDNVEMVLQSIFNF